MYLRWGGAAALLAAVGAPGSDAFVAKSSSPLVAKPSTKASSSSSSLAMGPPSDPSAPLTEQFGEGSRKYRRTVYTHDQWVKHRSSDRFVNNLGTLTQSGIYKQVGQEVFATVSIAVSVCVWNALVGGYQDFGGVMHDPVLQESWAMKVGLPMEAFTILSPSLGLLLVFRTNSSYKRWDEARKFWGLNINHTRDLNRMAAAWYGNQSDFDDTKFFESSTKKLEPVDPVERAELLGQVSLMTWAFVRSMKRHLSPPAEDEEDYVAEIKSRLDPEQAEAIISATHRPNRALYDLSVAIEKLPMHFMRKNSINNNLSIFEDTLGGSERLLSSPVPLFYSRHTARFLATWLLLLPLGLYGQFANSWNHAMMIPATAFISVCLFGIEELATQLEEPFTILPMQGFCDKIGANCDEIVSWAGDDQEEEFPTLQASAAIVSTTNEPVEEPLSVEEVLEELARTTGEDAEIVEPDVGDVVAADTPPPMQSESIEVEEEEVAAVDSPVEETVQVDTPNEKVEEPEPATSTQPINKPAITRMSLRERLNTIGQNAAAVNEPAPPIEAPSLGIIADSLPLIEEEATAEDDKSKVDLGDVVPSTEASEAGATTPKMFFAEAETKPDETKPDETKPELGMEKTDSQNEEATLVEEAKVVQVAQPENDTSRPKPAENRARRRMSLRERLAQIEERGNAVPVDKAPAQTAAEVATVEDFLPEEEMEKMTTNKLGDKAGNRVKARLSLREIVSGMN